MLFKAFRAGIPHVFLKNLFTASIALQKDVISHCHAKSLTSRALD